MRTVNVEGKEVEVIRVEPLVSDEKWNEYQMPDGSLVGVKLVATGIYLNTVVRNKAGEPVMAVDFQPVMRIIGGKE